MVSARQAHLLFFFVLIGIFIYTGIRYTKKVLTPRRDGYTQSAILRWSKQIQAMEDGENIHETNNYPNPPIMAQLLWPFSEIATGNAFGKYSPAVAALLWFFLKIGMAWLCIDWAFKMVEDPEHPMPVWAKFLAIGLSLRPIMGDLTHGNINIFILFLVMATLMAYRKGWHITAGVVLGLAIAAKVTPALFVVYFAWKRQLLLLLSCLVGLVLFFFLIPTGLFAIRENSLISGWHANWDALTGWVRGMIVPYLVENIVTPEHQNQSLPGLLTRLLSHAPSFSTYDQNNVYIPLAYHNFVTWDALTIKRIVQVCQFLFVALLIWTSPWGWRRPMPVLPNWRIAAEFSLIMLGMLIFSERTWKHHCVILLLPITTICYGIARTDFPKSTRRWLGILLALSFFFIMSTSTGVWPESEDITKQIGKLTQAYGAYTWAFFCQLGAIVIMLRTNVAKLNV